MPSERDLRRRVRSVKNIQQLTRAMQLVAASKMRRAQESVLASRPFEEKLRSVLNDLAPYADPELSPLLVRRMRASVTAEFPGIPDRPTTADTNAIARAAVDEFVSGSVDEVHLAFTRF